MRIKHWLRGSAFTVQLYPYTSSRMKKAFLHRSDADALSHDWQAIGNDIKTAMEEYGHEHVERQAVKTTS